VEKADGELSPVGDIKILSEDDIKKIAAGEVIERPASVLKELLENAVDSGARNVRVDIEDAGRRLIRVNDDGRGMDSADLRAACHRHATSKIRTFADLDKLDTFGFRGEALFSIAAVSKLSITSCTHEPGARGANIRMEGGKTVSENEAPPVPGTTMEVRDLFFNTPARLKFLKGDAAERARLLGAAEECALANPGVGFQIYAEGKRVYSLPAVADNAAGLKTRAAEILGPKVSKGMLGAVNEKFNMTVFVSSPSNMVPKRNLQFFFVNRRPVSAKTLAQAVYKAYEGRRSSNLQPACLVYLEMDPAAFDVNVHPQKKEVRFIDESGVFGAVYRTVGSALLRAVAEGHEAGSVAVMREPEEPEQYGIAPQKNLARANEGFAKEDILKPEPDGYKISQNAYPVLGSEESVSSVIPPAEKIAAVKKALQDEPALPSSEEAAPAWWTPPYRYLGQFEQSYLLFESGAGLVVIDQHAAQERILFEQYLSQLACGNTVVQRLMLPVSVELPASSVENIVQWKDWLEKAGFEIEQFGPRTVLVHAAPSLFDFGDDSLAAFVESLSAVLGDPEKCAEDVRRELVAMTACKKAVKAKDLLGETEALRLLRDLKRCENGLNCPHGRPTMILMPETELARRFRRT